MLLDILHFFQIMTIICDLISPTVKMIWLCVTATLFVVLEHEILIIELSGIFFLKFSFLFADWYWLLAFIRFWI